MTTTEIRAFEPSDTEAAGRLLAGRHAAHRQVEPLLSATFEDPAVATAQVAAALADGATGAVAVTNGEVTGYLLGQTKSSPTWGPNIWVESAGQAVPEAEVVRDLYAAVIEGEALVAILAPAEGAPGLMTYGMPEAAVIDCGWITDGMRGGNA